MSSFRLEIGNVGDTISTTGIDAICVTLGEVLDRIYGQVLIESAENRVPVGSQHQHVAVRGAVCHADCSGNAGLVFDNNGLLPKRAELVGKNANQDVSVAAGRERNNDFHGSI